MSIPAYITIAQMKSRYDVRTIARLLTDDTEIANADEADTLIATPAATAVLTQIIADSSMAVRQMTRMAFDTDDALYAEEVALWTYNMAMYTLFARRFGDESNPFYSAYQQTMSYLKDVRRGQIAVGSDPLSPSSGFAFNAGTARITSDMLEAL